MAKKPRLTAVKIWDREDIISCKCGEVAYTHARNGRAVSRSTEYRHWQIAQSQWNILRSVEETQKMMIVVKVEIAVLVIMKMVMLSMVVTTPVIVVLVAA